MRTLSPLASCGAATFGGGYGYVLDAAGDPQASTPQMLRAPYGGMPKARRTSPSSMPQQPSDGNTNGSAAIVMPDNVLFQVGAGETLRRRVLHEFDFHTLLRLPTGIFYSQGVKANVLFFDRAPPSSNVATSGLWVYDLRTDQRFTLRERPLRRSDLDGFVAAYGEASELDERVESERFRRFPYEQLAKRDKLNLDIFWLKGAGMTDPNSLPPPADIADSLELALEKFRLVAAKLGVRGLRLAAGEKPARAWRLRRCVATRSDLFMKPLEQSW